MFKKYAKDLLRIAGPIMMGNLGFIMIGVGDVIVAGRHSTDTLAAISIATAITNTIMMLGIGILVSISAVLSNYRGEGKDIQKYFYSSLKFGMILALLMCFIILGCIPLIDKIGFAPELVPLVKDYFYITAFATFGGYLHCVTKEYLQAFEIVMFPNFVTIICVFLNIILNIVLVFGIGPFPELGVKGLAIASLLARYFMGLTLLVYCYAKFKFVDFKDFNYIKDIVKIGLPASLAIMLEFTGFNAITVIMGCVSGIYSAAHNLMCTLTTVSFMIPLAVSNAAAIKVGYSNGGKYYGDLKKYVKNSIFICVGVMACSAIIIGLIPEFIIRLFTIDPELIKVCVPIAYVLCFFQIFDGLQVCLSGIFRGIKHTKVVMAANFIGYWIIAIPIGCILAFKFGLNLIGFWYALAFSSMVLCSIMGINLYGRLAKLKE